MDWSGAVRGSSPFPRAPSVRLSGDAAAGRRLLRLLARRVLSPVRGSGSPPLLSHHSLSQNGRMGVPAAPPRQESPDMPRWHQLRRCGGPTVCRVLFCCLLERCRDSGQLDIVSLYSAGLPDHPTVFHI